MFKKIIGFISSKAQARPALASAVGALLFLLLGLALAFLIASARPAAPPPLFPTEDVLKFINRYEKKIEKVEEKIEGLKVKLEEVGEKIETTELKIYLTQQNSKKKNAQFYKNVGALDSAGIDSLFSIFGEYFGAELPTND